MKDITITINASNPATIPTVYPAFITWTEEGSNEHLTLKGWKHFLDVEGRYYDDVTLTMSGMSDDAMDSFIDGFSCNSPLYYDLKSDLKSPTPWCAPWVTRPISSLIGSHVDPFMMGFAWADAARAEMDTLRRQGKFPYTMSVLINEDEYQIGDAMKIIEERDIWDDVLDLMEYETKAIVEKESPSPRIDFLRRYLELSPDCLYI